eukprot:TRINITY_DN4707_c0_g1_i4.p1 TRINITY_DN4707_c0_g1~~TRINITY_DN4707_c0_g1_i4.p1  ORF type:complete len:707 (-),score=199.13 TRINITY_DN4707_c0_g1_i4:156-2276(-)
MFQELVRLNFSSNSLQGSIPMQLGALAALELVDFSNNNLQGSIPISVTTTAVILTNNSGLAGSTLPSYLTLGTTFSFYENADHESQAYACRDIVSKGASLSAYRIAFDPSYLNYTHCTCSPGFFGKPPNCASWKPRVEVGGAGGLVSDTAYGNRIRSGLSTQYLIKPTEVPGSNETVLSIALDFLYAELSPFTRDTILIYAGTTTDASKLIVAFSSTNLPNGTVYVPAPTAMLHFISDAQEGLHFSANYRGMATCPPNFQLQSGSCVPSKIYTLWRPPLGLRVAFLVIASLLIIVCFGFFAFFYKFREQKLLKAVSPTFLMLTVVGFIFALLLPIFWNAVEDYDVHWCHIFTAFGGLSFSIIFGSLIAKTWRLYRIFWDTTLETMNLSDALLFKIISVFMAVEVVLVIIWRWAQPMSYRIHDVTDTYEVIVCVAPAHRDSSEWAVMVIFFVIQLVLLISGSAMATKVRKVPSEFNETGSIVSTVYNVTIISIICVPLHFALQNFPLIDYIIINIGVFLVVGTSLILLFAPKVASILFVSDDVEPVNLSNYSDGRRPSGLSRADSHNSHSEAPLNSSKPPSYRNKPSSYNRAGTPSYNRANTPQATPAYHPAPASHTPNPTPTPAAHAAPPVVAAAPAPAAASVPPTVAADPVPALPPPPARAPASPASPAASPADSVPPAAGEPALADRPLDAAPNQEVALIQVDL